MPSFRQVFIAGDGLAGIDLDRRVYVVRKRIEHEIGPGGAGYSAAEDDEAAMGNAAPPHTGVYFPSLSARTLVYKGMLISRQLTSFYADLRDERVESALALVHSPLLHQHLPVVAAGPPLPDDRPQRRDQHHRREPQLDAGPGDAALVARAKGSGEGLPDLHARRQRHRGLRRGARTADAGRLLAGGGGPDDDPGALGASRRDERRAQGVLPLPRHPHGALGRSCLDRLHPTGRSSARCWTATDCAPPAIWSPRTTWS